MAVAFKIMTPDLYEEVIERSKDRHYSSLFTKLFATAERLEARGNIEAAQMIADTIREHLISIELIELRAKHLRGGTMK